MAAFFLSGCAGLMHQVVWSKLLVNLIGATAYAQAAVLTVFMGGLANQPATYREDVIHSLWPDDWDAPIHESRASGDQWIRR